MQTYIYNMYYIENPKAPRKFSLRFFLYYIEKNKNQNLKETDRKKKIGENGK